MYDELECLCSVCGRTLAPQEVADGEAACTVCRMKATTPRYGDDEVAQAIRRILGKKDDKEGNGSTTPP